MAAKQCAKCDTEQHPALFGQPRGWRAVIKDDTLCDMCRDDKEWRTSFSCMSLSEQLVFAALIGDLYRVESLVGRGASLSTAHVAPTAIGDEGGCSLRLTPVAAAVLEKPQVREFSSCRSILVALLELGADCHTAVVCDTHGGDDDVEARAACGCVHGQTPLELVEKHDESLLAEHIRRRLFHGRGCRGTPIKERAAKVGVRLPPTPEGASKVQLRKHQKACRQKVATAEERADDDPMKRKRHLSLRAVAQAKYRKKIETKNNPL